MIHFFSAFCLFHRSRPKFFIRQHRFRFLNYFAIAKIVAPCGLRDSPPFLFVPRSRFPSRLFSRLVQELPVVQGPWNSIGRVRCAVLGALGVRRVRFRPVSEPLLPQPPGLSRLCGLAAYFFPQKMAPKFGNINIL